MALQHNDRVGSVAQPLTDFVSKISNAIAVDRAEAAEIKLRIFIKEELQLAEECADVMIYLLLIAERADIDLARAAAEKIDKNEAKYPVDKARGSARKYSDL